MSLLTKSEFSQFIQTKLAQPNEEKKNRIPEAESFTKTWQGRIKCWNIKGLLKRFRFFRVDEQLILCRSLAVNVLRVLHDYWREESLSRRRILDVKGLWDYKYFFSLSLRKEWYVEEKVMGLLFVDSGSHGLGVFQFLRFPWRFKTTFFKTKNDCGVSYFVFCCGF